MDEKSQATLWVPVVGSGAKNDPYRPNAPEGVSYAAELPVEIRPNEARYGRPLVTACRIRVAEKDAAKITNAVTPSARDEAVVEMCAAKRDAADTMFMDSADARARLTALAAKHGDDREALQEGLVQAALRGLRYRHTVEIAGDLGLL